MKIIGCIEANITFIAEIIAQLHGNYYSRRKFVDRKTKRHFIQRSFVIIVYYSSQSRIEKYKRNDRSNLE